MTITSLILAILGIISTVLAYKLNPKQKLYDELDGINSQLNKLKEVRDNAQAKDQTDVLTAATDDFIKLCARRNEILQRLGASGLK